MEFHLSASASLRYLSTAETAKALGVTARALRIYERRGLVSPLRTSAGWRAYGPQALARLHQVLALKRMGLSLNEIAQLLVGRLQALDAVLALQEDVLIRRQSELERGLTLVRRARCRLAAGETLSLDDLTHLTRETTMSEQIPEWAQKMKPIVEREFTPADRDAMTAIGGDFDPIKVKAQWDALIDEAKSLVGSDPSTPQALGLARRWRDMVHRATGGDAALNAKLGAVWQEGFKDPDVRPVLPFGPEVMAWVGSAIALLPKEG